MPLIEATHEVQLVDALLHPSSFLPLIILLFERRHL